MLVQASSLPEVSINQLTFLTPSIVFGVHMDDDLGCELVGTVACRPDVAVAVQPLTHLPTVERESRVKVVGRADVEAPVEEVQPVDEPLNTGSPCSLLPCPDGGFVPVPPLLIAGKLSALVAAIGPFVGGSPARLAQPKQAIATGLSLPELGGRFRLLASSARLFHRLSPLGTHPPLAAQVPKRGGLDDQPPSGATRTAGRRTRSAASSCTRYI